MSIEFTQNMKNYEVEYWEANRDKEYSRLNVLKDIFNIKQNEDMTVADVGCGPRGGIFNLFSFNNMYAVDPLIEKYISKNLLVLPENVVSINEDAQNFSLPNKADIIFSINALDHSGDFKRSIENIFNNLKSGGTFYLHVHMRSSDQLNAGHKMVLKEEDIDNILSPHNVLSKKILDKCPFDNKNYKSYVCEVEKV